MAVPNLDAEYFRRLKQTEADRAEEIKASLRPAEPVEMGRQVPWEETVARTQKGAISKRGNYSHMVSLLLDNEWDFKVGKSSYYTGDKYVQSSGEVKRGHIEDHIWLQAVKNGHTLLWTPDSIVLDRKSITFNELKIALETL